MNTNTFYYRDQQLHIEQHNLASVVDQVGTPCFLYSQQQLEHNIQQCISAFNAENVNIHYAMKANSNINLLRIIASYGLGVDIVSGGELKRALAAGFAAEDVIYSGVGKTEQELITAINAGVGQFNIESVEEFQRLLELTTQLGKHVNAVIRVNPEVKVDTHRNITTGSKGNKFGIAIEQVASLFQQSQAAEWLTLTGLAMHIGSQIQTTEPYMHAIAKMLELVNDLEQQGHRIRCLDLGGGFGVDYGTGDALSFQQAADQIRNSCTPFNGQITVEPGRSLVANTAVLATRVSYVKQAQPTPFVIVDAGMNDLMRPALYQAVHPVVPAKQPQNSESITADLVGPVCESTDCFERQAQLPAEIEANDLLLFTMSGAYCSVMNNSYNSRDIIPEVLINKDQVTVIRKRLNTEILMQYETPETL